MHPVYWSIPRIAHSLHASSMHRSLRSLVSQVRSEFPFDLIFAAWAYPDVAAAVRFAREAGVPVVAKVHGSDVNYLATIPSIRKQLVGA